MSTNNPATGRLLSRPVGEDAEHNANTDPAALARQLTPRGGLQGFRDGLEEASELPNSRGAGGTGNLDGQHAWAVQEDARRAAGVRRTGAADPWAAELVRVTDRADDLAGAGYDPKLAIDVETLPADDVLQATYRRLQALRDAIRASVAEARQIPAQHDDAVNAEAGAAVAARRSGKARKAATVVPIGDRLAEAHAELVADLADLASIRRAFDADLAPARERTRLVEVAGMAGAWASGSADLRSAMRSLDAAVRGYAATVDAPPDGKQAPREGLPAEIHGVREYARKAVEALDRLEGVQHALVTGVVAWQEEFPTLSAVDRKRIFRHGHDFEVNRLWVLERSEDFAYTDWTRAITEIAMSMRPTSMVTIPTDQQFAMQRARNEEIAVANGGKPSLPTR